MSARAICDVCKKEESIETSPMGLALMPKQWFVTVAPGEEGQFNVVDVCSTACAQAYDKAAGRPQTVVDEMQDGEIVTRTFEHKADN